MHIRAPCKLRKQERRDRVVARLTYTFPFPGMDQVQCTVYQVQWTRYSVPHPREGTLVLIRNVTLDGKLENQESLALSSSRYCYIYLVRFSTWLKVPHVVQMT